MKDNNDKNRRKEQPIESIHRNESAWNLKKKSLGEPTLTHLQENELKFHQSQTVSEESIFSPSSGNPCSSFSKMKTNSMQDSFLNNCRHDRVVLEINLVDHTCETGTIVGFDVNTLILENEQKYQFLVMKSAIIKIKPVRFVNYIFNDNYKNPNMIVDYSGMKNLGG